MGIVMAATRAPPVRQSTLPGSQNIIKDTTCATFNRQFRQLHHPHLASLSLSYIPFLVFFRSVPLSLPPLLFTDTPPTCNFQAARSRHYSFFRIEYPTPQQADPTTPAKSHLIVQNYACLHIFPIASGYCPSLRSPRVSCAAQGERVVDTDSRLV